MPEQIILPSTLSKAIDAKLRPHLNQHFDSLTTGLPEYTKKEITDILSNPKVDVYSSLLCYLGLHGIETTYLKECRNHIIDAVKQYIQEHKKVLKVAAINAHQYAVSTQVDPEALSIYLSMLENIENFCDDHSPLKHFHQIRHAYDRLNEYAEELKISFLFPTTTQNMPEHRPQTIKAANESWNNEKNTAFFAQPEVQNYIKQVVSIVQALERKIDCTHKNCLLNAMTKKLDQGDWAPISHSLQQHHVQLINAIHTQKTHCKDRSTMGQIVRLAYNAIELATVVLFALRFAYNASQHGLSNCKANTLFGTQSQRAANLAICRLQSIKHKNPHDTEHEMQPAYLAAEANVAR